MKRILVMVCAVISLLFALDKPSTVYARGGGAGRGGRGTGPSTGRGNPTGRGGIGGANGGGTGNRSGGFGRRGNNPRSGTPMDGKEPVEFLDGLLREDTMAGRPEFLFLQRDASLVQSGETDREIALEEERNENSASQRALKERLTRPF